MIQIIRWGTAALFCAVTVLFIIVWGGVQAEKDDTYPVITFPEEILDVSLHPDTAELLTGVQAFDEKDGNLTDDVIVESISNFIEPGICNVTYAVVDSSHHVTTAARKIRYTEYVPPRFTLKDDLLFSLTEAINLTGRLGANDVIDGDISSRVKISTNDNITAGRVGVYQISLQTSNSKGNVIYLNLPLYIEEQNPYAPDIYLKNYIIYTKVNEKVELQENLLRAVSVKNISDDEEPLVVDLTGRVRYETTLDITRPGVYQADYYVKDDEGRQGHAILMIVVEEEQ